MEEKTQQTGFTTIIRQTSLKALSWSYFLVSSDFSKQTVHTLHYWHIHPSSYACAEQGAGRYCWLYQGQIGIPWEKSKTLSIIYSLQLKLEYAA